jgi:succinate dehydrogenase flavin-adding protein (antitoxin of CptAB toxin-antitoxin module)
MSELKPVFMTPDGLYFDDKKSAEDHIRKPKIKAAFDELVGGENPDLSKWLMEKQEQLEAVFDTGTIRRVSKSENNKLNKALDALLEIEDNPKLAFLIEHHSAIRDSFRWPTVKRLTAEEKITVMTANLMAVADNDEDLVKWVIENKEQIVECYKAGVEKRPMAPGALEGLAKYRAEKAAEKAAKEAEEAANA